MAMSIFPLLDIRISFQLLHWLSATRTLSDLHLAILSNNNKHFRLRRLVKHSLSYRHPTEVIRCLRRSYGT